MDNTAFMVSAKAFETRCTHDRECPDVRRALRAYDPTLDCLWDNWKQTFTVAVRLRPGEGPRPDGYAYPLFPVGVAPRPDDVLWQVRQRDLQGRGKAVGKEMQKQIHREKAQADKEASERFAPNLGEYALRALNCDDDMTRRHLLEGMAKEQRRNA